MNTKQTNLFILLFFLAGISIVVGATEEDADLARVLSKRVPEEGLETMARASEIAIKMGLVELIGISAIKNFPKKLEIASQESKNTLLLRYSLKSNLSMVQCLVEANADVSAKNEDDWSALTLATRNKNTMVVKYLVSQNANVDIQGNNNRTPLMEAAFDGNSELVKFFIEKKAKLGEKDLNGFTALGLANILHRHEAARMLLEAEQN